MRRSFYHYVLTLKGPNHLSEEQVFANHVSHDIQFPKHTGDYDELSSYLEMNVDYLSSMDIFDRIYEQYVENNR
ncbi:MULTISPECIES: YozE family protein [Enterococcus]|jgi:uncharacterized protein YozE (UPF0346 family)|uniref:UPF0346 protein OMK_01177 n=1 Tax=Enterococcus dispar ATCC 51266 TaxID=1139219 RepID=S0KUE3_9ENTE|nr:YozE family protein [Enterococcus dispar]EOT42816.1 hypothetical protein OMK_01177 [Enterococcus dispar ATCC 51266]EOW84733.1 hypothetical protein I569_00022 [Enterococcus dispar ATCC 51266]MCU7356320.1 YozE family protein [Enterococcus dispar]MDT2704641.1 YozE family protein [Enterococcus dispar]